MVPKSILSSILVSNSREIHGDKRNGLKPTFFVDPLLNLEADVNELPDILKCIVLKFTVYQACLSLK